MLWRGLFTFLAITSLALCAAVSILKIRSKSKTDYIGWDSSTVAIFEIRGIISARGKFWIGWATAQRADHPARGWYWNVRDEDHPLEPGWHGFDAGRMPTPPVLSMSTTYVQAPHWAVIAALAILPTLWFRSLLRRRRKTRNAHQGLCPACGYDLRATPDRCPECGAAPPPRST